MRRDVKVGLAVGAVILTIAVAYWGSKKQTEINLADSSDAARQENQKAMDQIFANKTEATPGRTRPQGSPQRPRPVQRPTPAAPATIDRSASHPVNRPVQRPAAEAADRGPSDAIPPQTRPEVQPAAVAESPALPPRVDSPIPTADSSEKTAPAQALPVPLPAPQLTQPSAAAGDRPTLAGVTPITTTRPAPHTPARPVNQTPPGNTTLIAAGQAEPAARQPGAPVERVHVIRPGDTFASIAEEYYGSQRYTTLLVQANTGLDPKRLAVGAAVKIPPSPATAVPDSPAAGPKAGTPNTGAPKAGVPNGSATNPNAPKAGAPKAGTTNGTATNPNAPKAGASNTYTVKEGDTFYAIAEQTLGSATRWTEIYQLNKSMVGSDPSMLKVGQVLQLPKGPTPASSTGRD